jgi:hypothetical protein
VAKAIEAVQPMRTEWDRWDLTYPADPPGWRIEVKAAARMQIWENANDTQIGFTGLRKKNWDTRDADVFVFCLNKCTDRASFAPLDMQQWSFFVLSCTHGECLEPEVSGIE